MTHDLLDLTLLLQIIQGLSRKRSIDLQPIHQRRNGDESIRLHILVELVGCSLVQHDGVIGFVLDYLLFKAISEER